MSEQTTPPLLSLRNVQSGYGDLRVVWDVSLDVWPGKVTALLGRNGAGKTSTLRAISGLNRVSGGTIEFDGRDIAKVAPHRRVRQGMAYVQEGKRVFHRQTVEQNLILGGYVRRMSRSAVRVEVERIYELFPALGRKRGLLAGAMSGGQQQMLAIGQALMAKPTLLLLDEPSGGLAPVIVGEVMERVSILKDAGLAVLLVEQAVDAAMSVADHVTVLDVGRVVMAADAGDIDDRAVIRDAYFGRVG
ncbi:ABC transporter ATP-binding protein [Rhodococcus opacus]|uniref:Putative branched-chain amino acid ABC transporter ATP-binding protein n=1 Tax=Rhodococcus opacus (strain B4) TaxID=632772 RepID=C1ATE4_RHOOB|nr:ABC transporter ATP-binding protein [Rhodococcus opacus]BAH53208.1 putative branched-chain amino acid ABC transporter ATP-binding protein [Rhodococcus opacus B4]